jgi:FAD/FMN-containing dehydrogenase
MNFVVTRGLTGEGSDPAGPADSKETLMSRSTSTGTLSLTELRDRVAARVLGPDDDGYDEARAITMGGYDPRPALIVRPRSDADVAQAVTLAKETGLPLAVRSGGHSGAAHGTADGGVVIDVRDMKAIEFDVDARTAWAEAGLTAAEFTNAAAAHGLAVGFGDTGSVGLGGITLGGGVGFLARKHGLTIDSLLAADIVTADGEVLRVDEQSHPDLFWAIRGGGGNYGIATRFQFRLHPVDQVVGGMLVLPATAATVAGFLAAAEGAPEELTTIANVMNCPPFPFVPEEQHGSLVIFAFMCWAGEESSGLEAIAPFLSLAEPLANLVRPMPYPEMYGPEDSDYHPTAVARTMLVDSIGPDEAATIVELLQASDAIMRVAQLRVLGGAVARVPADATAYAHRDARIMVNIAALYDGPADREARAAWVDDVTATLHQGNDGAYVNFLQDEGPERIRAAYPGATWDRLATVKAAYDPENVFRLNHNVPPATANGRIGQQTRRSRPESRS